MCFGDGSGFVEIRSFLGASLDGAGLNAVRSVVDPVRGHGLQDGGVELVSSVRLSGGIGTCLDSMPRSLAGGCR